MGTAELALPTQSKPRALLSSDIMLISFFFFLIKLLKTCPEVHRREGEGGCFGLQRHSAFDLSAEQS